MNALTRTAARAFAPRAKVASRQFSTASESTLSSIKNSVWLSDPGAYPVIGVCVFAVGFCTYTATKNLVGNCDVRWDPKKRQSVIRTN